MEAELSPKSRKCDSKAFEKTHLKNTLKNMKNVFRIPPKMKAKKVVPGLDFEVWRQRCSQGGPKGSLRHPPGPNI